MSSSVPLTLLVIAGGRSRRMGEDKALLRVPPSDLPLILHTLKRLRPLGYQKVVVVANNAETIRVAEQVGAVVLRDEYADAGPLGGLATGLAACEGWAAVVACDMPLVKAEVFGVLAEIAAKEGGHDAVIPQVGGYAEVMHALYHRRCAEVFAACVRGGTLAVRDCLERMQVRRVYEAEMLAVDPALESFANVNTPEEWAEARRRLADGA